jgi:hypothetical protein
MLSVCGYIVCGFVGVLALMLLWFIWTDKIDLSRLLSEANGSASLSRLQLLIFTFVIAISLFLLVEKGSGNFPEIPSGVLTLLGISASTYAVGKGISFSREEGVTSHQERMESHARTEKGAQAIAATTGMNVSAKPDGTTSITAPPTPPFPPDVPPSS